MEQEGDSVLITAVTGCGKSHLASNLGYQACLLGYKAAYLDTQKLMLKTKMTRLEGTVIRFFDKLAITDLPNLDDFGLTLLESSSRWILWNSSRTKHGKKSLSAPAICPSPVGTMSSREKHCPMPFSIDWSILPTK